MIRPRRTGSLTTTATRGSSPVYRGPGRRCRARSRWSARRPLSQKSWLKWVTCTIGMSRRSASGCRASPTSPRRACCARGRPPAGRRPARGAVQRGPARARAAAAAPRRRRLASASWSGGTSATDAGQSQVRARPSPSAPRSGVTGQQVLVAALDERRRPRPVHVPEQDLHRGRLRERRSSAASSRTASTSSATPRQAGVARHRAGGRPGVPAGAPAGRRAARPARRTAPSARAGTTGANSDTTGVPTAAARCAGRCWRRPRRRPGRARGQLGQATCRPPRSVAARCRATRRGQRASRRGRR